MSLRCGDAPGLGAQTRVWTREPHSRPRASPTHRGRDCCLELGTLVHRPHFSMGALSTVSWLHVAFLQGDGIPLACKQVRAPSAQRAHLPRSGRTGRGSSQLPNNVSDQFKCPSLYGAVVSLCQI